MVPSIDDVKEAVAKFKGGKAAGICNISIEMLKAKIKAMIRGLHAVLTAVWHSGTISLDWKKGLVIPIWKGERRPSGLQQLPWYITVQHTRQSACPFAAEVDHLLSSAETPET